MDIYCIMETEYTLILIIPSVSCKCEDFKDNQELVEKDAFFVEKSKFSKSYLKSLLNSNNPKDKIMLNLIVTKIIKNDHKDSFAYLLDHGYKIDILNNQNQSAIHLAIYNSSDNILNWGQDFLLSKCRDNAIHTDNNGLSYLHFACMIGKKKTVKILLDKNPDVNAQWYHDPQDDRDGFTPLHFAVYNHKTEIVKYLLHCGANVNSTDSLGRTPLHLACCISKKFGKPQKADITNHHDWNSEMKIIKLLVAHGADLNLRDKLGNTSLLSIFKIDNYKRELKFNEWFLYDTSRNVKNLLKRQKEKLDYLIEHGVDVTVVNHNGENILHRIIGDLKILRFPVTYDRISFDDRLHASLISQLLTLSCGIDVNQENNRGETPLLCAISFISLDIVKILLEHNADMDNLKFNYRDKNFFNYPGILPNLRAMRNLLGIIDLLEDNGFEMSMQDELTVLRFLIHKDQDCECCCLTNLHNAQVNMMHTFYYGDPKHIEHVNSGVYLFSHDTELEPKCKSIFVHNVFLYSKLCKLADMYYPKEYYNGVKKSICCSLEKLFEKAKKEVVRMKSIKLNKDDVTLHDLLIMDLNEVYYYVKDGKEVDELVKRFPCYRNIFEGRFTQCISVTYFYDAADDYLRVLTVPTLSDFCCAKIKSYLSLHELLNVCLAAADIQDARSTNDALDLESLSL